MPVGVSEYYRSRRRPQGFRPPAHDCVGTNSAQMLRFGPFVRRTVSTMQHYDARWYTAAHREQRCSALRSVRDAANPAQAATCSIVYPCSPHAVNVRTACSSIQRGTYLRPRPRVLAADVEREDGVDEHRLAERQEQLAQLRRSGHTALCTTLEDCAATLLQTGRALRAT